MDDVGAQVFRTEHFRVLEEVEYEGSKAVGIVDRELDDDRAVGSLLDHGFPTDDSDGDRGLRRLDEHLRPYGLSFAQLPRLGTAARNGDRRRVEASWRSDLDVAGDTVEPEHPLVVTNAVVAGDVPATAVEVEPVRVDLPLLVAVRERDGAALPHRPEQLHEANVDRDGRNRRGRRRAPRWHRHATELPEPALAFDAFQPDGGRREMQGRQLVRLELRVAEVVLVF